MKILCVHAHFDDFELVAAGTFQKWQRMLGSDLKAKILVCTDGKAGHHFRTREETGPMRYQEQAASARIGGYDFELLQLPNGNSPREACIQATGDFLAALWKSIRSFEPDYLFCPPLPIDPLAGVHPDHWVVAEAVRKVAYLINVPHAFTPEYPTVETHSEPVKTPVILNVHDGYMAGSNHFDLVVDVEEVFPIMAEMAFCHKSQLQEWIPWVGRHQIPAAKTLEAWMEIHRAYLVRRNREMSINTDRATEVFSVTAWGTVPTVEQLKKDIPGLLPEHCQWDRLSERLSRWQP